MERAKIKLNLVQDVLKLAEITQRKAYDVLLRHNSYVVDATSILGIMSLNLSEPVIIEVVGSQSDGAELFKELQHEGFEMIFGED